MSHWRWIWFRTEESKPTRREAKAQLRACAPKVLAARLYEALQFSGEAA